MSWTLRGGLAAPLLFIAAVALAQGGGNPTAGRSKATRCQTCHGLDGIAVVPDAPHIAGQPAPYLSAQLRAYRAGARKNDQMSLVVEGLSDADIADLAAWYASIEISAKVPAR